MRREDTRILMLPACYRCFRISSDCTDRVNMPHLGRKAIRNARCPGRSAASRTSCTISLLKIANRQTLRARKSCPSGLIYLRICNRARRKSHEVAFAEVCRVRKVVPFRGVAPRKRKGHWILTPLATTSTKRRSDSRSSVDRRTENPSASSPTDPA